MYKGELPSLNRTFNPKYTHYIGDGSGRDAFIIFTNGGFHDRHLVN